GHYPIALGNLSAGPNYTIELHTSNFEITQAVLNIIVDSDQQKVYGTADPTFYSFDPVGFKYSDDESILMGALTRELGEDVGKYEIARGTRRAGAKYTVELRTINFAITQAV